MKFGVIDFIWASLQVAFIVLKLCGVIDWSWWLVFTPVLSVVLFSTLCFVVVFGIKNYAERRDRRVKVEMYGTANPLKIRMVKMQRQREELERRRKELEETEELIKKMKKKKKKKKKKKVTTSIKFMNKPIKSYKAFDENMR